jgi:hypothetical protein
VPGGRATGFGGLSTAQLDDVLLSSWLPRRRETHGTFDGVGLGRLRYSLPAVNSDRATHLLQFDGASRNNPGGGRGSCLEGGWLCVDTVCLLWWLCVVVVVGGIESLLW